MDMIADILLVSGALGVAFYCFVLSRRLTRFTDLEQGVGGAVAVLSAQVDDLNRALDKTRAAAQISGDHLRELTERADGVARRLELHVAAMHDLPAAAAESRPLAEPMFTRPQAAVAQPAAPAEESAPVAAPAVPKPQTGASPVPSFFSAMKPKAAS